MSLNAINFNELPPAIEDIVKNMVDSSKKPLARQNYRYTASKIVEALTMAIAVYDRQLKQEQDYNNSKTFRPYK